jgi:hypothetical protein
LQVRLLSDSKWERHTGSQSGGARSVTDAEIQRCRRDGQLLWSVVSQRVKLKKSGRQWNGCCPFHADSTPSFTVYNDGHFHCFGCGAHGTIFDYVMLRDRVEFAAAVEIVAVEAGLVRAGSNKGNGNGTNYGNELWQSILPVPADAPRPNDKQLCCDVLHEYCDVDDRVLCYVCRHEAKGTRRKRFIPLTFGVLNGKRGWHDKAPQPPRPLYGLDRLSHAPPGKTVIVVEGEKAADAGQRILPAYAVVSWMGGAQAVDQADWSPLNGHKVIIWPDADKSYCDGRPRPCDIATAALAKRFPLAKRVDTTGLDEIADGYDAADLEYDDCEDPETWLMTRLRDPPPTGASPALSVADSHGAPPLTSPNDDDDASPIDLQSVSPKIAELITSATENGRPVRNFRKSLVSVARYLYERRHSFAAVLATLKAHPDGVGASFIKMQTIEDTLRLIWDRLEAVVAMIVEFNDKFFVVNENGRACIYAPRHDRILNRRVFDRLTFADLEKLYANRRINSGDDDDSGKTTRNVANIWLTHPERRQFIDGITFDPACRDRRASVLNLWEGFAVEPCAGSWAKLQAHIRDVVCNGNPTAYEYLLDAMADTVQNPAKQGEVAVVLRGVEGCGKGVVARALRYIFGQHGLAISNVRHLIGNFNAHLRDCVFLFADEAFYAGDKRHIGVLKALVTEPYLTIEGKYQNAYQAPNFLHVWLASNEDWVVPASLRSRRWFVLDVSDARVGDQAYFAAIYQELENGGYAAMLHDLMQRDLSRSNLRAVPVTAALVTQRKRSLDTTTSWWLDCLHRGYVFSSKCGLEEDWQQWHAFLPTEVLYASYSAYCRDRHERHPLSRELLGGWFTDAGAKQGRRRNRPVGEHIIVDKERGGRIAELITHPHPYGYNVGALASARAAFCRWTALEVDWGQVKRRKTPAGG